MGNVLKKIRGKRVKKNSKSCFGSYIGKSVGKTREVDAVPQRKYISTTTVRTMKYANEYNIQNLLNRRTVSVFVELGY